MENVVSPTSVRQILFRQNSALLLLWAAVSSRRFERPASPFQAALQVVARAQPTCYRCVEGKTATPTNPRPAPRRSQSSHFSLQSFSFSLFHLPMASPAISL